LKIALKSKSFHPKTVTMQVNFRAKRKIEHIYYLTMKPSSIRLIEKK
jgi:hypothetical protein